MTTALARIAAGANAPGDLEWLAREIATGHLVVVDAVTTLSTQERLDRRDEAIRAARPFLAADPTVAAKELAAILIRRVSENPAGESEEICGELQVMVRHIIRLNKGSTLRWRQIHSIFDGVRKT